MLSTSSILFCTFLIALSNSEECGHIQVGTALSFGGEYAFRGQWPWLAPLFYNKDNIFFCGSTIISERHLLSASHCFNSKGSSRVISPETIHTLAGRFDLNDKNEQDFQRRDIDRIKVHKDWDTMNENYDGDIAILFLATDLTFTKFIQPACLPETQHRVFEVDGYVAGYGLSENSLENHETRPKFVKIASVTHEDCLFTHPKVFKHTSRRMFCAGETGKNPCKGDSGGGFFVRNGNSYTIIGIVSSSIERECKDNQFVLFTNIPKFIPWIQDQLDDEIWISNPLKCEFKDNPKDERYECFSFQSGFESKTSNVRVSSVEGSFTDGKTYTDVDCVVISTVSAAFIPEMTAVNKKLPNFRKFFMVFCGLKYIERSKLAKMPQLRILNFYGNDIEHFEPDVFDDLVNLEIIAFVRNKIKILPQQLLWNLVNLKEIWSFDNPLEAIPIRFFKNNKKLEKAWMGNSKIKKIGVNFKSLPKLNIIDLRENVCIDKLGCPSCDVKINEIQDLIDRDC